MDKIYVVECGYKYEGGDVEFIAKSQAEAEAWRDKYFEFRKPWPDDRDYNWDKKWCHKFINCNLYYDYIEIKEIEVGKDPYDTQCNEDSP